MSDSASKFDSKKVDLSLIPEVAEIAVARAMMYGEKKYGRYNYCKGHDASQLVAAARRHLSAWFGGEENDPESGVSHLGHVMANCRMILRQQELGTLKDNRYTAPKVGRAVRPSPLSEEEKQPLDEEALTYRPERMAVADDYKMIYTVNGKSQTYAVDEKRGATPYYDQDSTIYTPGTRMKKVGET